MVITSKPPKIIPADTPSIKLISVTFINAAVMTSAVITIPATVHARLSVCDITMIHNKNKI